MRLVNTALLAVVLGCTSAHGQDKGEPITLLADTLPSVAQRAYLDALESALSESGFDVRNEIDSAPMARDELARAMRELGSVLGLSSLQRHIGPGDAAAALLSTPGGFATLAEQRTAQLGIIGDRARDEVAGNGLFALRLWPHSTSALASSVALASVKDFRGVKTRTGDPSSVAFIEALGGAPVPMRFAEVMSGLQTGVADAAELLPSALDDAGLALFEGGAVVAEYAHRVGVTFASAAWWTSLTAPTQRAVIAALGRAEFAASTALADENDRTRKRIEAQGISTVSWNTLAIEEVRAAVDAAITIRAGDGAATILELRDDLLELESLDDAENYPAEAMDEDGASLEAGARVFFASDRRLDSGVASFADRFANAEDPQGIVRCGELAFPSVGPVGEVVEPPTLVNGTEVHERSDCIALVSDALAETGGRLVIYVHGFRNDFASATGTGLAFARDARIDGVVLVWTWPSGGSLESYDYDAESLTWSQPHFVDFIEQLARDEALAGIDFIGHSMGTRLLTRLMRDHWTGAPSAVVLAAADVSRPVLRQAIARAPSANITVLATEWDRGPVGIERAARAKAGGTGQAAVSCRRRRHHRPERLRSILRRQPPPRVRGIGGGV